MDSGSERMPDEFEGCYFVGFVPESIPLGSIFRLNDIFMKLEKIYVDGDRGVSWMEIPQGYKAICRFSYLDGGFSEEFENLPKILSWSKRQGVLNSLMLEEVTKQYNRDRIINDIVKDENIQS